MNKIFKAALGLFFLILIASCTDKESPLSPSVDENIIINGLIVDLTSSTYSIPIKSDGKWTASIPDDCHWAEVITMKGEGDADLVLYVDDNTEGIVRTVPVSLTTPAGVTNFNLVQDITIDGEPATNAGEIIFYSNLASSKGLGQGYDLVMPYKSSDNSSPTTLNLIRASVINVPNLVEYFSNRRYYNNQSVNQGQFYDINEAMFENKKDSLGVTLSVKISYGAFKFDMHGNYDGNEDRITDGWHINYSQDFPVFNAYLDYASITSDYWDYDPEFDRDDRVIASDTGILNAGFVKRVKKILNAADDSSRNKAIANLIDIYGTGVVVGTTLGGNVALDCYVDTVKVRESLKIHGDITASFKAALFSIDAGVTADYLKTATASLNNSCHELAVRGGSLNATQALLASIRKTSFTERNVEEINQSLQVWGNSIKYSDDLNENTAEILKADIKPIWLFVPYDIQDKVRDYILTTYPNAEAFASYRSAKSIATKSAKRK